jgi:hypothetical protein
MEKSKLDLKVMEFSKTVFDDTFNYVSTWQSQNEKIALHFLEKLSWFPEEGKKAISQFLATYKKTQEDFKSKADEHYKKMTEYLVPRENRQQQH